MKHFFNHLMIHGVYLIFFGFGIRIYPYHITRLDHYFLHLAGAHFVPLACAHCYCPGGRSNIYTCMTYAYAYTYSGRLALRILTHSSWRIQWAPFDVRAEISTIFYLHCTFQYSIMKISVKRLLLDMLLGTILL